jgi:hypothetical protein
MKSKHILGILLFALVAVSLILGGTYAQRRRGQATGVPRYDKSTEVTLSGSVERVVSETGRMGWMGTHLVVRFDAETLTVHLGPSSYLTQMGFTFAEGDRVEVTGSKVTFDSSNILVARAIRRGDRVLNLRDQQGIPAWSRGRWRY